MGFYRVHMLDVISVEFLIVPLILLVGGFYTFFTAIFGVYATMKEDSCLVSQQIKERKNRKTVSAMLFNRVKEHKMKY